MGKALFRRRFAQGKECHNLRNVIEQYKLEDLYPVIGRHFVREVRRLMVPSS